MGIDLGLQGLSYSVLVYALLNLGWKKTLVLVLPIFLVRSSFTGSHLLVLIEFSSFVLLHFFFSVHSSRSWFSEALFTCIGLFAAKALFLLISAQHQIQNLDRDLIPYLILFFFSSLLLWVVHEPGAIFEEHFFSPHARKGQLDLFRARLLRKKIFKRRFGLKDGW